MKVLLIGSGGREHAIALALRQSPLCSELYIAPGNPGMAALGTCLPANVADALALADLAEKCGAELVVVGPEVPLVAGAVDELKKRGIPAFGPTAAAAALEGSKAFSKNIMKKYYKAHPWHGIQHHPETPKIETAFIEIIPSDTVKYEIDKISGYLKIDRPQLYSNVIPALYGFIPQTYCDEKIAALARDVGAENITKGDHDPLDILVLSSHVIPHGDIIVDAIPIGGFCLVDNQEADDKIIAVLKNDHIYGNIQDIKELPDSIIDRLKHYFLTYKSIENRDNKKVTIEQIYTAEHAKKVILAAKEDYNLAIGMNKFQLN